MLKKNKQIQTWRSHEDSSYEAQGILMAYWEVDYSSISDNYTVQEISAMDLFKQWVELILKHYPNHLIPIYWSVECQECAEFEEMPFQFQHSPVAHSDEDFLSIYTHPTNSVTGERLNWLDLPVVDKLWNSKRADKGGFIQQATGWKPSILQPYVYLPALTNFL